MKEAIQKALGKIKSARDCHFKAIDTLLFEAEEILEATLATPQPAQQEPLFKRLIEGIPGLAEELKALDAAQPEQEPVAFPTRKAVEREIERTANPTGMHLNDGKERVALPGGTLRHMLALIDRISPPAQRKPLTPDMFWNQDDAETPYDSIEEFLNHEICNGYLEVGAVFTLLQAKRFPSVKIKVTSIDENECEAEYEIIEAAHNIKENT